MDRNQTALLELPMLLDPDPSCPVSRKELWAERDLFSAIRYLIKESEALGGISVHFFHDSVQPDLSPSRRLGILCIAREALLNAAQHSKTRRVLLSLCRRGRTLELSIEDNGIGFDVERRLKRRGTSVTGLRIMEERASQAGGTLSIQSFVRGGTRVTAKLPLPS